MPSALDRPEVSGLLTHWTAQPVAIVLVAVLGGWYLWAVRRTPGWSAGRSATFGLGLALLLWLTCGWPGAYADSLFWVWTSQTLALWLLAPLVILSGQPVQLARIVHGARIDRVLRSRPVRIVGNPLVGPALVPALSAVLFFGVVPGWAAQWSVSAWALQVVALAVGAVMVVPLVGLDEEASSLAVGLALAIGSFELVIDALPGIAMRLSNSLLTSWFDHRTARPWSPTPLHDQQLAGGILWCVAELIDLPFLVLVYRRWLRADARDAARIDAVLEAERAARRGLRAEPDYDAPITAQEAAEPAVERDAPWWLSDPAMLERLRRQR